MVLVTVVISVGIATIRYVTTCHRRPHSLVHTNCEIECGDLIIKIKVWHIDQN